MVRGSAAFVSKQMCKHLLSQVLITRSETHQNFFSSHTRTNSTQFPTKGREGEKRTALRVTCMGHDASSPASPVTEQMPRHGTSKDPTIKCVCCSPSKSNRIHLGTCPGVTDLSFTSHFSQLPTGATYTVPFRPTRSVIVIKGSTGQIFGQVPSLSESAACPDPMPPTPRARGHPRRTKSLY